MKGSPSLAKANEEIKHSFALANEKVKYFLDSNVVLYLLSSDASKQLITQEILRSKGTISVQVLNEITNVLRRKLRYTWAQTHEVITALQAMCEVVPLRLEGHNLGRALAERYGFSVYDAMIVSAAVLSGAHILYSEDMQHELVIESRLTIVNPYAKP